MVVARGEAHAQTVTRAFLRADNPSPQQATTTINFYASAEGGNQPHEFKWWLWDGTAWRVLRDWNFSSGFAWTPETPGQYMIAIWARSQGSSVNAAQALAQIRYDITPFVYGAVPKIQIFFTRNAAPHYVNTSVIMEAWISGSYEPEL